jgi:shikimate kinase
VSLIGMAGSGKSHWSKRLAEHGFTRFCCDELIAEKLTTELAGTAGRPMTMGEWMGFPYEAGYKEREARYLALEREVMAEIITYLEGHAESPDENIVVDTTGSVIYTGNENLARLRLSTTVVYLPIEAEVRRQLLEAYTSNPHPMLWRGVFRKEPRETNKEALARCYPKLVLERERVYEKLSDVTINYHRRRGRGFEVHDFLNTVASYCPP